MSLEEFAAAFTSAFRGYLHPVALDAAALGRRVRLEQYDLQHSLVAYDGDELAGVAALAMRADSGWCGGFGIVPEQRGRGRGRELMSAMLASARAAGLRRLSLEVLVRNTAARRLYEGAGMKVARDLLVLERAESLGAGGVEGVRSEGEGEGVQLKEAAPAELLAHFARLHAAPPAWQRDLPSLFIGRLRGFYMGERARPDAYALLGRGSDGNPYVADLGAADGERARALCERLARAGGTLKVVNEPEHSLFTGPLLAVGFTETERQHEMRLEL